MKQIIRQPIVTLLGHVDHGKTSILDLVRGSSVALKEAGGITQCISAYSVPIENIKKICGGLLKNISLTIPGILFIDSPGHEAFTTLRKRGGSIADIAVLVIDINEGLKPQTREAIEILKNAKTPFVVAANKIDKIGGWRSNPELNLLKDIEEQSDRVIEDMEAKLYRIIGGLSEYGFNSERFDRVKDYTREIAIIPTSAKTGEGFPELLMVITGLSQRYLEESLRINVEGQGKGTILEVSEEKGMGKTLDCVLYDGVIKQNDALYIGAQNRIIKTKIRCLFLVEQNKLKSVEEAHAACALKISAPDIDDAIPGMPIRVANDNAEEIEKEIRAEIQEVLIEEEGEGIIVKADTLGSLEALTNLLKKKGIKIKKAGIGDITKKDLAEACTDENPLCRVVIGFNVKQSEPYEGVKVFTNNVIYKLIEDLEKWIDDETKRLEAKKLEKITRPFKIQILKGYVFRQSNPAVVGVEVLGGVARTNTPLMKADGRKVGDLKSMQEENENISEAEAGKQVAIAMPDVTIGRQVREGDILYSDINEDEFRKLKELKKYLNSSEVSVLKEIVEIKRKDKPTWGI
jgi:translation initiation factor 5B